jgi:RNA polymerase sigma-70 factor (ECF subfamily)
VSASESGSLRSLRRGGSEVQEEFVRANYAPLFRWLHWLSGEYEEAADLTQETFAAFWDSVEEGNASAEARVWLFAVGRNVWRNAVRCRHRVRRNLGNRVANAEFQDRRSDPALQAVLTAQCAAEIRSAVSQLAPDIAEAVTLRYWAGCSYAEMADVLSISPELARQRVFQGRKQLRRQLKAWAPDDAVGSWGSR